MADRISKEKRSHIMSCIRSRGNRTTEIALLAAMRQFGISGWRRRSRLQGKPDFIFPKERVAVFVDGCFWHGCKKCGFVATSNVDYWTPKISATKKRDLTNARLLRSAGWNVVRFWEHELKASPSRCIGKLAKAIAEPPSVGGAPKASEATPPSHRGTKDSKGRAA